MKRKKIIAGEISSQTFTQVSNNSKALVIFKSFENQGFSRPRNATRFCCFVQSRAGEIGSRARLISGLTLPKSSGFESLGEKIPGPAHGGRAEHNSICLKPAVCEYPSSLHEPGCADAVLEDEEGEMDEETGKEEK